MRYHRFIGPFDLSKNIIEVSDNHIRNQWHSVLRLKTGDTVILCDGEGTEAEGTITNLNKKTTTLAVSDTREVARGIHKQVTLFTSILRRENFEIVVQKATEIGITKIVPLITERTVKTGFNKMRLEKILIEASEQCGRTTLPILSEPMSFVDALHIITPAETIVFDGSGTSLGSQISAINLFVGPEGGFSDKEINLAKDAGCVIASLGELTLRAETATIVVSYLATQ